VGGRPWIGKRLGDAVGMRDGLIRSGCGPSLPQVRALKLSSRHLSPIAGYLA
jgi:hypothetical protein